MLSMSEAGFNNARKRMCIVRIAAIISIENCHVERVMTQTLYLVFTECDTLSLY